MHQNGMHAVPFLNAMVFRQNDVALFFEFTECRTIDCMHVVQYAEYAMDQSEVLYFT